MFDIAFRADHHVASLTLDFLASGIERLSKALGMKVEMETKLETEMTLQMDEL